MAEKMTQQTWTEQFVDHLWTAIGYRQLARYYWDNRDKLQGGFFVFTGMAINRELIMVMAHAYDLAKLIAEKRAVGSDAQKRFEELTAFYDKNYDKYSRNELDLQDCGIHAYRDKIVAHPLNHIKEILGKDQYQISLKWETIEETLEKMKQFATAVEENYNSDWGMRTGKEDIPAIADGIDMLRSTLKSEGRYLELRRKLILRQGKETKIVFDPNKRLGDANDLILIDENGKPI
jgi:hypothetical protein